MLKLLSFIFFSAVSILIYIKRFFRDLIYRLVHGLDYHLYRLWVLVYGEPDHTDVIIFNEMPKKCRYSHVDPNCPKKYCETCRVKRLLKYINKAKVSIDIAQLTLSHSSFYSAVASAWLRGIQVRLLTDSQMIYARGSLVQQLVVAGVPSRRSPLHVMMHHKFCIIDGEQRVLELDKQQRRWHHRLWYRRGYVITGSLNWTNLGTGSNYENVVITSNRVISELYQDVFNDMWNEFPVLDIEIFRWNVLPCENDNKHIEIP